VRWTDRGRRLNGVRYCQVLQPLCQFAQVGQKRQNTLLFHELKCTTPGACQAPETAKKSALRPRRAPKMCGAMIGAVKRPFAPTLHCLPARAQLRLASGY